MRTSRVAGGPDPTRRWGYSTWGEDREGTWHLCVGFDISRLCPLAYHDLRIVAGGLPPEGKPVCGTCLRLIPVDCRVWLTQRAVEGS